VINPTATRSLLLTIALSTLVGCRTSDRVVTPLPDALVLQREPSVVGPSPGPTLPPPPSGRTYRLDGKKIVVDAGHGGRDPGALAKFPGQSNEKTINLDISRRLAAELQARGASVIMTRTSDTFPSLEQRADVAERHKADLFVSVHANSIGRSSIYGAEFLIYRHASRTSLTTALVLNRVFRRNGIDTRGVHRRNLKVLREHSRPGVLIECGFLTNRTEAKKLNTVGYRQKLAEVIAEGIAEAIGR
jgi:N-acetylmuramoyl-L-alanine amidase